MTVVDPENAELVVSVHQPNFLPWVKLLDKILASDVFIAYDTVQYTRDEYHARQRIKHEGGAGWLTVPVPNNRGLRRLIRETRIDNAQPFRAEHLRRITRSYGKTPFFDEVYPLIEAVYRRDQAFLVELTIDLIETFCGYLGSPVRIVRASSLPHGGDKTDRLVQLVRAVGGSVHLTSTVGGNDYLDRTRFCEAGLGLRAALFDHPEYEQPFGTFMPNLSALDMLFCVGRRTGSILAERRMSVDVVPTPALAVGRHRVGKM